MSTTNQPHILVVGGGSIGQRHIKNLLSLGVAVSLVDPVKDLLPVEGMRAGHRTMAAALAWDTYTGAIVAVPTYLHAQCALPLLQAGLPVLIEKPLAHTVAAAESLRPYASQVRVGYSMRFSSAIQAIKQHLPEIGRIIYAHAEVGQHLPQWHPTEDYRQSYMAKAEQGGGAILDLSHELDYLQWLIAPAFQADAFVSHLDTTLEINSDDCADILGWMGDTRFSCHTDLIDRRYNRRVRILGEKGTIQWCHSDNAVVIDWESLTGDWRTDTFKLNPDRNIQFIREAEAFLAWCADGGSGEMATFDEAYHTLKVVEALVFTGAYPPKPLFAGVLP